MEKKAWEKEAGNVHYLKPTEKDAAKEAPKSQRSSEDSSYQDLVSGLEKRLEQRIASIEKEFTQRLDTLGNKKASDTLSQHFSDQLASMVTRLEERIQSISRDAKRTHPPSSLLENSQKTLLRGFQTLKKFVSTSEIRDLLKDLWFGQRNLNDEFDEFGMDPRFKERVKPLFDFLYYDYWRVSVKGLNHIPNEGAGLIVPNHSGTFPYDGAMIAEGIVNDHPSRKDVRFLVEDFVYHFPFMGTFMYRIGGVRACPENCERLLSKKHLVTVFPEGIKGIGKAYKNRYRLQRFGRGGFIKLALRTQSPIIPTAVIGAEEIHPLLHRSTLLARPLGVPYIPITPTFPLLGPLGLIPFPSKWTIVFGEPIHFSPQYGPESADDQLLVNRLSEMVREKIQDMIVEELKLRRSVWFG